MFVEQIALRSSVFPINPGLLVVSNRAAQHQQVAGRAVDDLIALEGYIQLVLVTTCGCFLTGRKGFELVIDVLQYITSADQMIAKVFHIESFEAVGYNENNLIQFLWLWSLSGYRLKSFC